MHYGLDIFADIPAVSPADNPTDALPIVIVTLVIALIGGGIIHGLSRNRSCLARIVAVVIFTLLVVAGLLIALVIAYDFLDGGILL